MRSGVSPVVKVRFSTERATIPSKIALACRTTADVTAIHAKANPFSVGANYGISQPEYAIGLGNGQSLKECSVHYAENRSVAADSERKSKDSNYCETGGPTQSAQRQPEILKRTCRHELTSDKPAFQTMLDLRRKGLNKVAFDFHFITNKFTASSQECGQKKCPPY